MTEHDSLETELSALRPREPSAELKQRIAECLALPAPVQLKRRSRSVLSAGAFVGSLVATGLLALVLWRSGDRKIEPEESALPLQPLVATAFDDSLPSVWSYRSAVNQSPEALDSLLDKHALRIPEPNPKRARVYVFARFNSESDALSGEL